MSDFICPFCRNSLIKEEKRYICENGHSFDIAKEGYVHLLPVNKMHSKEPGDTKEMVLSRRRFLSSGSYKGFSDKLNDIVSEYADNGCHVLDAGCGEGYYTKRLSDYLCGKIDFTLSAFDISKTAVRYASKSDRLNDYAVASVFDIPVNDNSIDILINIFAPVAVEEYYRVLKTGGVFIYAVPSDNHLWGLKKAAYDNPYKNEVKDTDYEGFEFAERISVRDNITLDNNELISDLFTMTPYYWKTSIEGSQKIKNLSHLETEIGFDFLIYRKK